MTELSKALDQFYIDPYNNYDFIQKNKAVYREKMGDMLDLFLWMAYDKYPDLKDKRSWTAYFVDLIQYEHFKNKVTQICDKVDQPGDIDALWLFYYVTGDMKYPLKVKELFTKDPDRSNSVFSKESLLAEAARWSYTSHVKREFFDDPDVDLSDEPELGTLIKPL